MIIAIGKYMFNVDDIQKMEKMVVRNNRCSRIEVSKGFRSMGNGHYSLRSNQSSYKTYHLEDLDGKEPLVIDAINFGNGASVVVNMVIKAIEDDIIYCVKNNEVLVGKEFSYHGAIAHDTDGVVKIKLV